MPSSTRSLTDTLTETLSHLVRFPTITGDNATNGAALDWVEQQLQELPLKIQRPQKQGVPTLIATTMGVKNPKNPRLWLAAHIDVVPADVGDFEPSIRDGRLFGRGSHDMKNAIASYIMLLQELGPDLIHYDLGLMLTSDEEIGGQNGVGWLVNDLGYRAAAVLMPDTAFAWQAEMASKGLMRFELTATGVAAHAARPWQGVNAIDELTRAVNLVRERVPAEPCGDPHHNHATVNLSKFVGGEAINHVPKSATALIDIRFPNELTFDDINGWITATTTAVPTVKIESVVSAKPFRMPPNPAMDQFKAVTREVTGREITYQASHASSDARWFAWKNIPVINVGITGSGYHTTPEWIDINDLGRFYKVIKRFVEDWAKLTG